MNDADCNAQQGVLSAPDTLTIQRLLPGPIERVWAYLTESELRGRWLASGSMDLAAGRPFELVWRNDGLSDSPSRRPEGFAEEQRMPCRIVEVDPPRRLVFTWQGSGDVAFDLQARGEAVMLTVTHARLPDRKSLLNVSAGWHMHLNLLEACATGAPRQPFWEGWARLHQAYDSRWPAALG